MGKLDYISILAGGSCKFNCSFCIGNSMRKNITPHYSKKWESFLNCFADQTDLLSVSGDTSDPSLIEETIVIPTIAKIINPNIKVSIHTKETNSEILEKYLIANFDKLVISIDENFLEGLCDEDVLFFRRIAREHKLRFSIVLTSYNFGYFVENNGIIEKLVEMFPTAQITLRPEVSEEEHISNCIDSIGTWTIQENGSCYLEENMNIWLWEYSKTNQNINALYLFSDGIIKDNCRWDNIKKEQKWHN